MKKHRFLFLAAAAGLIMSMVSCQKSDSHNTEYIEKEDEIKVFSSFIGSRAAYEITSDNAVKQLITEKIKASCEEEWLQPGDSLENIIENMILNEEYPDFLYPDRMYEKCYTAGALAPIDEYWDGCDNLKKYFTDAQWDRLREDDGHIYKIPIFSSVYMYDTNTVHDDEAFWIQVKVLKWAGYPKITTVEEYFDLLERYIAANPVNEYGVQNIGFDILTDGTYYFCLENPPQFLDGYPNDGCCIVDPVTLEAKDYNVTDTAKKWFSLLNKEYKNGLIDPECFILTRDQYFEKISSGAVLGLVDQRWNFGPATDSLPEECTYIPLGIVAEEGIKERYHSEVAFDDSSGMCISVSCDDPKGAVKFLNDLLDPEIHNLRFWGIEGTDYEVASDGHYYQTEQQRVQKYEMSYLSKEFCDYNFFPFYKGMSQDGINAYCPSYQPDEFFTRLSPMVQECFSAYGVKTYVEMLNKSEKSSPWYPMWSYSNTFTTDTPYGKAKADMDRVKHEYLPKVVMSDDFEASWEEYMDVYNRECDVKAYLDELTAEVRRRSEAK